MVLGTSGTGMTIGLEIELNSTNIDYLIALGNGSVIEAAYAWLAATYAFASMAVLLGLITVWMVFFSATIGLLNGLGLLSSSTSKGLTLSTLETQNQTNLVEITNNATGVASSKGFGVQTTTPPIPGFEMLFVLIPLMVIIAYYGIARKRKNDLIV